MNIIMLGAPGAGKGTQAKIISKELDVLHISTGDLLRKEVENGSAESKKFVNDMDSGGYVEDDIVTKLLIEKLALKENPNGFVLDGYPRNIAQAHRLLSIVPNIHKVIDIHVDDEIIINRMGGRVVCPSCGLVFHKEFNPPRVSGICDSCNAKLIRRDDDSPEIVAKRLEKYHNLTTPIINFYNELGIIETVSGLGEIDQITSNIIEAVKK